MIFFQSRKKWFVIVLIIASFARIVPTAVFADESIHQAQANREPSVFGNKEENTSRIKNDTKTSLSRDKNPQKTGSIWNKVKFWYTEQSNVDVPVTHEDVDIVNTDEESPAPVPESISEIPSFISRTPKSSASILDSVSGGTSDGSFGYTYTFTLPPGRNEVAPNLTLHYASNSNQNGAFGYGWSLSLPYIELMNKTGTDRMYDPQYRIFNSSLSGELKYRGSSGQGVSRYGARNEESFFDYVYNANLNTWSAVDTHGTMYLFGSSNQERVVDPSNQQHVFRWMISRIIDTHGNTIDYAYSRHGNELYPSDIWYTGTATQHGPVHIVFNLANRPDDSTSFATGFEVRKEKYVSRVEISFDTTLVRRYDIAYTLPSGTAQSLLTSITETGYDNQGIATSLPATTFSYTQPTLSWNQFTNWSWLPDQYFVNSNNTDTHINTIDLNGDGWVDLLDPYIASTGNQSSALHSTLSGWASTSDWDVPHNGFYNGTVPFNISIADGNGDWKPDFLSGLYGNYPSITGKAHLNNGINGFSSISIPLPVTATGSSDQFEWGDLNGDGLLDVMRGYKVCTNGANAQHSISLNRTGTSWQDYSIANSVSNSEHFLFGRCDDRKMTFLVDINGDGLDDVVAGQNQGTRLSIYINTGNRTWLYAPQWSTGVNIPMAYNSGRMGDMGARFVDVNTDGLVDLIYFNDSINIIFLNTGDGWNPVSGALPIETITKSLRIIDVNADGLVDFITSKKNNGSNSYTRQIYRHAGNKPNLMSSITFPEGGQISISYTASTLLKEGGSLTNPHLPLVLFVPTTITYSSMLAGPGASWNRSFKYYDGEMYYANAFDRGHAGFGKVVITQPDGSTVSNYYHQGNATNSALGEYADRIEKIGKSYRSEVRDSTGNLFDVTVTRWNDIALGNDRYFTFADKKLVMHYDGTSQPIFATAEEYIYDQTHGAIITSTDYGEVMANTNGTFTDTGTDTRVVETHYAYNPITHIVVPKRVITHTGNLIPTTETKYLYDALPYGSVSLGDMTRQDILIQAGGQYASTLYSYDQFGNRVGATDPSGATTQIVYDTYALYPNHVTNSLGHESVFIHDYSSGQIRITTDPNGYREETIFDGLDRPVSVMKRGINGQMFLVREYAYTASALPNRITTTDWMNTSDRVETHTYFDGFGRVRQVRKADTALDTFYNFRNLVTKQTLPYSSIGSSFTQNNGSLVPGLSTGFVYDVLGRIISETTVLGTSTTTYSGRHTTTNDTLGNTKEYIHNTRGHLLQVQEHNGSASYTTHYTYDSNDKLTRIVDAEGNERNFTYDMRGLRLTAEDLHQQSDIHYNIRTYVYDSAGDMVQYGDSASGDIVHVTYDTLHRPLRIDAISTSATDIIYKYDSCTNGVGKLCKAIADNTLRTSWEYGKDDLPAVVQRDFIGSSSTFGNYSIAYEYDRQGNIIQKSYDNDYTLSHHYNSAGLPDVLSVAIDQQQPTVVASSTYTPHGQPSQIVYGNGGSTQIIHDTMHLYRMTDRVSRNPQQQVLQNIQYTYDAVGNIIGVTDTAQSPVATTTTYTYDSLYRLIGAQINPSITTSVITPTSHSYTYSPTGNITSSSLGSYTYTDMGWNNPHTVTSIAGNSLGYDSRGNVINYQNNSFTYDWRNRMITSTVAGSLAEYRYDHEGNRVSRNTDTSREITIDPDYTIRNGIGELTLNLGNTTIGTIEGNTIIYQYNDHLNSSSVRTDASGVVVQNIAHTPFGDILYNDTGTGMSGDIRKKYTGHPYDTDTGLSYMQARYYDGAIGRFMSIDPLAETPEKFLTDPQQLNGYSYVRNNPMIATDPDGNVMQFIQTVQSIAHTTNRYINSQPNIPSKIREASFATSHPVGAYMIGSVRNGSSNMSTVASNVTINITRPTLGYGNAQAEMGSERNALRHTVWQGLLARSLGSELAWEAGNSHEYNPFTDTSIRTFSNKALADQTADILNNQIGRDIVAQNPDISSQDIVQKSLDYFYTTGLFTIKKDSSGVYDVIQTKLPKDLYTRSSLEAKKLNTRGLHN